jgi:hypothetical protein
LSAQILSFILRLLRPLGGGSSHSAAFDWLMMQRIGDGGYQRSRGGFGSRRSVIADALRLLKVTLLAAGFLIDSLADLLLAACF